MKKHYSILCLLLIVLAPIASAQYVTENGNFISNGKMIIE